MVMEMRDQMRGVRPLWESVPTFEIPPVLARSMLTPNVQYLRASNGAIPDLAVVPSSIEYDDALTRVRFAMVDVANFRDDDDVTAMCIVPVTCERSKVKSNIRHVRDLACAPFN